jgi:UTP--glucose-1-phosphate uridylyltransferase
VDVRKAVIPAAGLGTRFLPASKAIPKEMVPVVDKPAIQYVVEECVAAGITDVLVVTGRNKSAIEDHFDRAPELESNLEAKGKDDLLKEVRSLAELADVHFVRQREPLGLGHAVSVARQHVGDEPFAVLLGDDLMVDDAALLRSMISASAATGRSVIALKRFPPAEISAYGCVRPVGSGRDDGLVEFDAIIEKPKPEEAPSDLGVMGRYVFTPGIFDALDRITPGGGGVLQLTVAFGFLNDSEGVLGLPFSEGRYDAGNKLDYLRATVELALARDDLGPPFRAWLQSQTWD